MPKAEVIEQTGCTRKLHVEVERERFDQEFAVALKTLKKDLQIPGFRKGRAPESLLLKRYGDAIKSEAVRDIIPKVLGEVLEKEGINPVNEPDISDLNLGDDGPITFDVMVEVVPDIDLEVFDGLEVTRQVEKVTDEQVDGTVERYRHMRAERNEVDRETQVSDIVVADMQKLDHSGVPIIGEKYADQTIPLEASDEGQSALTEQLVGLKAGDKKVVDIPAPEGADEESVKYEAEIKTVYEYIVPELTDEFAKELGSYEGVEDLKAKVREYLEQQADYAADTSLQRAVIDEYVKSAPFDVPDSLVNRVLFSELEKLKAQRRNQPVDEDAYMTQMRPDAVRAVQTYVIIDTIKDKQKLEATTDEVNERIEQMAQANNMEPKQLRRHLIKEGQFNELKDSIMQRKAYDWIKNTVTIHEEVVEPGENKSNIISQ